MNKGLKTLMDEKAPPLVYIASAPQDEKLRNELERHLTLLVKRNYIRLWHQQQIPPGTNAPQIQKEQLAQASIILLLMSIDFINDCSEEMEQAALRSPSAKVIPNLSRADFDLILAHRKVPSLERTLADRFYTVMQQNALYLDLVAKELLEAEEELSPDELINRLTHNPNHIFSLAIERFERRSQEWEQVLQPILGLLLVAREPLRLRMLRSILRIGDRQLRNGIQRLGGLLIDTGEQRYTLFHLKLRDYLRQQEDKPDQKGVFATDEEQGLHAQLARWCEQGDLALLWKDTKEIDEQEKRLYARKHLIAHWYFAHQWDRLFALLDEGSYGRAKERYDLSTRSYIQDLDFGRQAAAWEGWTQEEAWESLPRLWCYTLLRCSLRSRSDNYPYALFQLMLLLGREQEVLGHAELLTDPVKKAKVFHMIAEYLSTQPGRQTESQQLLLRMSEITYSIKDSYQQAEALRELAQAMVQAGRWEQAEEVARSIMMGYQQGKALSGLAQAFVQAECWEQAERLWEQAEEVAHSIMGYQQGKALRELVQALVRAGRWEQAEEVARSLMGFERAEALSTLAQGLMQAGRWEWAEEVARSLMDSEQDKALSTLAQGLMEAGRWEQAKKVARSIIDSHCQAQALRGLAEALAQAERWEEAEKVARSLMDSEQDKALSELAQALMEAERWEEAKKVACSIMDSDYQAQALSTLAQGLMQVGRWEHAEKVARSITQSNEQASVLNHLMLSFFNHGEYEKGYSYIKHLWLQAETRTFALAIFTSSVRELVSLKPDVGIALYQAFQWVDTFLGGKDH